MELKADLRPATATAHRLPCTVHYNGAAPSARAFGDFPAPLASFRGRQLRAGEFELDEGSEGMFVSPIGAALLVEEGLFRRPC